MCFNIPYAWLLLLVFTLGCSKKRANIECPTLIEVENFSWVSKLHFNDTKITGAWCFLEDEFIGYYPLPNSIPVFTQQTATMRLLPGIYANGIAATPEDYPFYQAYEFTFAPSKSTPVSITPITTYKEEVKISLFENFENGQTFFTKPLNQSAIDHFQVQQMEVYEGQYAAKIELDQEKNAAIEIATAKRWSSASLGRNEVYLEVQYQATVPLIFGLVGFTSLEETNGFPLYYFGLNPSENWNKIYLKLDDLLVDSNIQAYSVCLSANLEGTQLTKANIYLDNIKLIHF